MRVSGVTEVKEGYAFTVTDPGSMEMIMRGQATRFGSIVTTLSGKARFLVFSTKRDYIDNTHAAISALVN